MTLCLDTNVVIAILNRRPDHVRDRLRSEIKSGTIVGIPSVVVFELRYGAAKSVRRLKSEATLDAFLASAVEVWNFDSVDAAHAGEIRALLERDGRPMGAYDYLIAGQARARGATLVSSNVREFGRVPGLQLVDWSK